MKMVFVVSLALTIAAPAVAHDPAPSKPGKAVQAATDAMKSSTTKAVRGHSGGTDANGCHTNHKTGDYHCHKPK